jgi:hypothetical protein
MRGQGIFTLGGYTGKPEEDGSGNICHVISAFEPNFGVIGAYC